MTTGVIVAGFDGSAQAAAALRWAAEEAKLRGARLRAVYAWSYLDQAGKTFDPGFGEDDVRRLLDDAIDELGPEAADIDIERVIVNDLPARGLLEAAQDADLVVVGARGVGGFRGLLLGSVSQQVAHHAPCPVVIVPQRRTPPAP